MSFPSRLVSTETSPTFGASLADDAELLPSEQEALRLRKHALRQWFNEHGSVLLGFSGGVDSAYLAAVALETLGPDRFLAVIGRSASYPEAQWNAARAVAKQLGLPLLEVDTDELNDPRYAANPSHRCYFCKGELWSRLTPIAKERGLAVVIDGTNADDLHGHRPGARAGAEAGVRSPLAELGFTKPQIREASRALDLPTANVPSSPCLSSRIPYGTEVTAERLASVEGAESALRALGVRGDLRVRYHGALARIELGPAELTRWMDADSCAVMGAAVRAAGFDRVAIDLAGFRSGSLNVLAGVQSS